MKEHAISGDYRDFTINAIRKSPLFATVDPASLERLLGEGTLVEYGPGELLMREGDASDRFGLIVMGEVTTWVVEPITGEPIELGRIKATETIGEMGLMTKTPRTATSAAVKQTYCAWFNDKAFDFLLDRVPGFSRRMTQSLAQRLAETSKRLPLPDITRDDYKAITADIVARLPADLVLRRKAIPLQADAQAVLVGLVDVPDRNVADEIRNALLPIRPRFGRISAAEFDVLCEQFGLTRAPRVSAQAAAAAASAAAPAPAPQRAAAAEPAQLPTRDEAQRRNKRDTHTSAIIRINQMAKVEPLLRVMVEHGASDLHINARQSARWRIDGDLYEMPDAFVPNETEVLDIFSSVLDDYLWNDFEKHHDVDFAFAVDGLARFRCNMFRDHRGVGCAMRLVPSVVPSMDQVGIPKGAQRLTELAQGLILVCGPTGSGKSTTLASMIDHINNYQKSHIITIEDPIEFHHTSKKSLVTQREVGKNTSGFQRALRSALREDPDIVLVGELRDIETMELAMETAQTGHLVFSTMHTNSAIQTIDRIVDIFPSEQQNQIRSTLADVLKGVVNQVLCKRIGGGRVAAFETLVVSSAVANLIRQAKTVQIQSAMATGRAAGNCTMNEDLESLVKSGTVDMNEALSHTYDRKELRTRFGLE
jgi:twitching motility protein PilT